MTNIRQPQVSFRLKNNSTVIFRGDGHVAHFLEDYRKIFTLDEAAPSCSSHVSYEVNLIHDPRQHDPGMLTGKSIELIQNRSTEIAQDFSQSEPDIYAVTLMEISMLLGAVAQEYGGGLVHGALGELNGKGFLMAAPGGTGKSTASDRLPWPFISHCDDMTLIVKDDVGKYWAHPFPTWSRFLWGQSGGTWNFGHAIPLHMLYYLAQSENDHLSPMNAAEKAARCIAAMEQASRMLARNTALRHHVIQRRAGDKTIVPINKTWFMMGFDRETQDDRRIRMQWLENASQVSAMVPSFMLHLSLNGAFWELIKNSL